MPIDPAALDRTRRNAVAHLLAERHAAGHWAGELSASALSTATAVVALRLMDRGRGTTQFDQKIAAGTDWLIQHQNSDGGWGDTVKSLSNISTTTLVWAALGLTGHGEQAADRAGQWLASHTGGTSPEHLAPAILARYGKDRTFSVPILMMATLCGRMGNPDQRRTWQQVKQLPFELAALPQSWFNRMNLQVVSYALPALIAIGQLRHARCPARNPVARLTRHLSRARTLKLLEQIQPDGGGFLEATPLTSFVTMALAGAGLHPHAVARRGTEFLEKSMRPDGSWPIDTNLATWVTTLSVNALAAGGRLNNHLDETDRQTLCDWLLNQQYLSLHPYTQAAPGGWSWTNLPGGVPDADDTSGALLALKNLGFINDQVRDAAGRGIQWLNGLQNRDGGMPTFCRGWGKLPFDRSCRDISAHAIRARHVWRNDLSPPQHFEIAGRNAHALEYLEKEMAGDGSWLPLWFGNQHLTGEENPTYGTSRVLLAWAECPPSPQSARMIAQGVRWLAAHQNADGGWGGGAGTPSTIEETALAIEALLTCDPQASHPAIDSGLAWLITHTQEGTCFEPSPIGFYFAKLWYFERLYPVIFTVAALERASQRPAQAR